MVLDSPSKTTPLALMPGLMCGLMAALRRLGRMPVLAAGLTAAMVLSGCVVPEAYPAGGGPGGTIRQEVLTSNGKQAEKFQETKEAA